MTMGDDDEKDRLQRLHMALEASLEQLGYAQQIAAQAGSIEAPSAEMEAIEKIFAELNVLRNGVRDRLMKRLSRPSLNVVE
jgi:hypothetical protein